MIHERAREHLAIFADFLACLFVLGVLGVMALTVYDIYTERFRKPKVYTVTTPEAKDHD